MLETLQSQWKKPKMIRRRLTSSRKTTKLCSSTTVWFLVADCSNAWDTTKPLDKGVINPMKMSTNHIFQWNRQIADTYTDGCFWIFDVHIVKNACQSFDTQPEIVPTRKIKRSICWHPWKNEKRDNLKSFIHSCVFLNFRCTLWHPPFYIFFFPSPLKTTKFDNAMPTFNIFSFLGWG